MLYNCICSLMFNPTSQVNLHSSGGLEVRCNVCLKLVTKLSID